MQTNDTIATQLNHRTVRQFTDQPLDKETLTTLYEVARRTATSQYLQQFSLIHVTDLAKKRRFASICRQPAIAANGDLFIFVADLRRNQQIRRQNGADDGRLHTMDLYLQGMADATLALQNMYVAAESLGLGGVILGSIRNDLKTVTEILDLPAMVIPVLGLRLGVPAEDHEQKPRLPQKLLVMENTYNDVLDEQAYQEFDQTLATYYAERNANARQENFTSLIAGENSTLNEKVTKRDDVLEVTHAQGLLWK